MIVSVELANTQVERQMPLHVLKGLLPDNHARAELDTLLKGILTKPNGVKHHVRVVGFPPFTISVINRDV